MKSETWNKTQRRGKTNESSRVANEKLSGKVEWRNWEKKFLLATSEGGELKRQNGLRRGKLKTISAVSLAVH